MSRDALEVAEVVAAAEVGVEVWLLHDGADAAQGVGVDPFCGVLKEADAPRGRLYEAQEHPHSGGLAGAVRPQQSEYASAGDLQRQVVHGRDGAVALAQALRLNNPAHSAPPK